MELVLILLSYLFTKLFLPKVKTLFISNNLVKVNYQGKNIPVAMGIVIGLVTLLNLLIYEIFFNSDQIRLSVLILSITLFVGFTDDILGNNEAKGLKGHILKFIQEKKLTTGFLKAVIISIISLYLSVKLNTDIYMIFVNFLILILLTNSFNLFDLRPGRAVKVFFFFSLIIILFIPDSRFFLSLILFSLIAYFPWDLKGKVMLGDTGANFLGMVLGLVVVFNIQENIKLLLVAFLIFLHIYTEKYSLSKLIDKVYFLRLLDEWGR